MRNDAPRVCIVGAGAAGLSLAYALSSHRINTRICDAGKAGQGALAASAGMIAPGAEIHEAGARPHPLSSAFARLAVHSASLWPAWAQRLRSETGIDPEYRASGSLIPLPGDAEGANAAASLQALGVKAHRLTQAEAVRHLPGLDSEGSLFLPGDAQLSAPRLGEALITALRASAHAELREQVRVTGIEPGAQGWRVRLADGETIETDCVVLAAGWAAETLHPAAAGVFPVKGQALMLQSRADAGTDSWPLLRAGDVYLASKPGGRVLVGASAEPGRSDTVTDTVTADTLLERAARHVPAIASMRRLSHWAGVRPALPGMMPRAGEAAPGLFVALGAYRHGVMLAPALAEGLARAIAGEGESEHLVPFAPPHG